MESNHTGPRGQRCRGGIATGAQAEPGEAFPNGLESGRRGIRYGLGLLPFALCVGLAATLILTMGAARADSTLDDLIERLDRIEAENHELRQEIDALRSERAGRQDAASETAAPTPDGTTGQFVKIDSEYGFAILDPDDGHQPQAAPDPRAQAGLERSRRDSVHVQGAVTAVARLSRPATGRRSSAT